MLVGVVRGPFCETTHLITRITRKPTQITSQRSTSEATATITATVHTAKMDNTFDFEIERQRAVMLTIPGFLDWLDNAWFNGLVNVDFDSFEHGGFGTFCFTDDMAQALGLALLRKKDDIRTLILPIGQMSRNVNRYPALVQYFKTAMPSSELYIVGDSIGAEHSPVTTHEIADVLLSNMVKQNRKLPLIHLLYISLSPTSMEGLTPFTGVDFHKCDINEHHTENQTLGLWSGKFLFLAFYRSSPRLMNAARKMLPEKGDCPPLVVHVDFDPSATDHKERLYSAIQLAKVEQRVHKTIQFGDIDTYGSNVVQTMLELAWQSNLELRFEWNPRSGFDKKAIRSRAQEIVNATSQCRFLQFEVEISNVGSIFDTSQLAKVNNICAVNRKLPDLVDSKPEEFWMNHLDFVKQLLTPEYLLHPRFQDTYYRFIRKNFIIHQMILTSFPEEPQPLSVVPQSKVSTKVKLIWSVLLALAMIVAGCIVASPRHELI